MNKKQIEKLLLTVTIADSERFTAKNNLIIYIEAFAKLYNQKICRQIYKIYKIIELKKWQNFIAKYPYNLGAYYIIEIFSILHNIHVISWDKEKIIFYVNNYIVWD